MKLLFDKLARSLARAKARSLYFRHHFLELALHPLADIVGSNDDLDVLEAGTGIVDGHFLGKRLGLLRLGAGGILKDFTGHRGDSDKNAAPRRGRLHLLSVQSN